MYPKKGKQTADFFFKLTFVHKTGAANKSDKVHTTTNDLRQLVIVQRDLDFIGNTMTINLKKMS